MMSPLQLENRILTAEKSLTDALSGKSWFFTVGILICLIYAFFSYPLWFEPHPEWSRFYLFQNRYWGAVVMGIGGDCLSGDFSSLQNFLLFIFVDTGLACALFANGNLSTYYFRSHRNGFCFGLHSRTGSPVK